MHAPASAYGGGGDCSRPQHAGGAKLHPPAEGVSAEMLAATLSWAIYGAAKEWVRTPGRCSADEVVDQVMGWSSRCLVRRSTNPTHDDGTVMNGAPGARAF